MKPVTMYEANDGSRWDTATAATLRDLLISECAEAVEFLRPRPNDGGCRFDNGHGFVQQPTGSRDRLWAFLKSKDWNRDSDGPISRLSYRAMCLDDSDREWGQPYFALNPGKGEDIAL